jgi:hypothetical protein
MFSAIVNRDPGAVLGATLRVFTAEKLAMR